MFKYLKEVYELLIQSVGKVMKKKLSICLVVIVLLIMLTSCMIINSDAPDNEWADDFDLVGKVLNYVQNNYISDIDIDKLDITLASALVSALDNFSYLTDNAISLSSNVGIGMYLNITKYHEYVVTYVQEGMPSAEVKEDGFQLRRGDFIYAVNGERVEGRVNSFFTEVSAGGEGTELTLTIKRDGVILGDYTYVKREGSVKKAYYQGEVFPDMENVGYIRLTSFTKTQLPDGTIENASDDFDESIRRFKEDGKNALVLDLRGNSGGSSDILSHIASYFIPLDNGNPRPFLCLEYAKSGKRLDVSVSEDNFMDIPLVILTDGNTASAAEALTGACRAFNSKNTTIIGTSTYGKGVFQSTGNKVTDRTASSDESFEDSYYIVLVAGYYYIYDPSYAEGRYNIHNNPIIPDITIKDSLISANLQNEPEIAKAKEVLSTK